MEINTRNKRYRSPAVDLTAMVDLGFLLITFFMLASSFAKPSVMEVFKQDDSGSFETPESKTSTILLGPGDKAYCYSFPDEVSSLSDVRFDSVGYHAQGLRNYIMQRQAEVALKWGSSDHFFLIIKPMENAPYERMIDVLDEVLITGVKHYAIMNPKTAIDSIIIAKVASRE